MKKKHLLLLPALATLMMSCNENSLMDENSTKESSSSSSSVVSQNYLGKYGEGAMYAGIPIVGYWNMLDTQEKVVAKLEFNSDGVYSAATFYNHYGVSGNVLKAVQFMDRDNKYHIINYNVEEKLGNSCLRISFESNTTSVRDDIFQLCKTDTNTTKLTEGVNVGRSATLNGYYGKGIRFGNHLLEGKWREYYFEQDSTTDEMKLRASYRNSYDSNSTLTKDGVDGDDFYVYGVSGGGDEIIWSQFIGAGQEYIELVSEYNSTCYNIYHKDYNYELYDDENYTGRQESLFCKLQ